MPASRRAAGARAPAPATTTTTATTISSSPTGARTACTATTATARSTTSTSAAGLEQTARPLGRRLRVPRLRPRRPARSVRRQLHRPRSGVDARCPTPACAATRAFRSRAARPVCRAARTCSIATRGDGTFEDVSETSGITRSARHLRPRRQRRSISTTTAGSMSTSPTTRIRARSIATTATAPSPTSALRAGCAYSQDGKPQAGMGVAVGDYDRNGTMDIFKTNFAGDTSTLYANTGDGLLRGPHVRRRHRPQHALARVGRRLPRPRQRRLARSVPRQRPRLSRGRAAQDRGRLQAAQGRLPQPAQRPVRGRHRAARRAGDDAAAPAAAPRSPTSTTTATSTSSSTTSTTRRISIGSIGAGERALDRAQAGRHDVEPQRDRRPRHGRRPADGVQSQEVRGGGSYYSQNDLRAALRPRRARPRSSASRCAGRTASRRRGPASPSIGSHTLTEGTRSDAAVSRDASPLRRSLIVVLVPALSASRQAPTLTRAVAGRGARARSTRASAQEAIAKLQAGRRRESPDVGAAARRRLLSRRRLRQRAIEQLRAASSTRCRRVDRAPRGRCRCWACRYYLAGRFAEAIPLLEETRDVGAATTSSSRTCSGRRTSRRGSRTRRARALARDVWRRARFRRGARRSRRR